MLNKICELEDQVESLNDNFKKLQLKVTILENQKEIVLVTFFFSLP